MSESHERRRASMRVHGGLRLASTGVTWTTPGSFHGRMAFPCRWIQWPAWHTIAAYSGPRTTTRTQRWIPENRENAKERGREKGDLECHRGRLKDKYSAHRRHLTLRESYRTRNLDFKRSWSRSSVFLELSSWLQLPLLLLLSRLSQLLFFRCLCVLSFNFLSLSFFSSSLLPTPLSTSFLDLLIQSAVSAAAISLSDKSQVLRSRKELKALLLHGARTEEAQSCVADVTMRANCYAWRTLKLWYLRELYYQLSRPRMVSSLTRRTERFLLLHWFVSFRKTVEELPSRFVESKRSFFNFTSRLRCLRFAAVS